MWPIVVRKKTLILSLITITVIVILGTTIYFGVSYLNQKNISNGSFTDRELMQFAANASEYPYKEEDGPQITKNLSVSVDNTIEYSFQGQTLEIQGQGLVINKQTNFYKEKEHLAFLDGLNNLNIKHPIEFIRYTEQGNQIIDIYFKQP